MSDPRTFKVPTTRDGDTDAWRQFLLDRFDRWHIQYPLEPEGPYDVALRSATASFMRAWGVEDTGEALKDGLTPWWRTKLRDDRRSSSEEDAFMLRVPYRRALRDRYRAISVCYPVPNLITDAWGWHGAAHDGIDLVCPYKQPILAICDAIVRRVSPGGWWGKGAKPTGGHPVTDGDGIVIIECTVNVGPFRKGLKFGYGHSEGHVVKVGDKVRAGEVLGYTGWANGAHTHFMVNDDQPVDGFYRGTGDRDPAPFLAYAKEHS